MPSLYFGKFQVSRLDFGLSSLRMDAQDVVMCLLLPLIVTGHLELRGQGQPREGAGALGAEGQQTSARQERHDDYVDNSRAFTFYLLSNYLYLSKIEIMFLTS